MRPPLHLTARAFLWIVLHLPRSSVAALLDGYDDYHGTNAKDRPDVFNRELLKLLRNADAGTFDPDNP